MFAGRSDPVSTVPRWPPISEERAIGRAWSDHATTREAENRPRSHDGCRSRQRTGGGHARRHGRRHLPLFDPDHDGEESPVGPLRHAQGLDVVQVLVQQQRPLSRSGATGQLHRRSDERHHLQRTLGTQPGVRQQGPTAVSTRQRAGLPLSQGRPGRLRLSCQRQDTGVHDFGSERTWEGRVRHADRRRAQCGEHRGDEDARVRLWVRHNRFHDVLSRYPEGSDDQRRAHTGRLRQGERGTDRHAQCLPGQISRRRWHGT